MTKSFGFTGTQQDMPMIQRRALFDLLACFAEEGFDTMHNGSCIGADAVAAKIWKDFGEENDCLTLIHLHPSNDSSKRAYFEYDFIEPEKPYLVRNRNIVDSSVEMIGCPQYKHETVRSGTWSTIRYADKKGKPIYIVWPDGSITTRNVDEQDPFKDFVL